MIIRGFELYAQFLIKNRIHSIFFFSQNINYPTTMPSLLPATFLENSTHLYLPKVQVKILRIYGLILGFVVAFFSLAFWITIDVSFSAPGVTRSLAERTELRALVSGQVQRVAVRENLLFSENYIYTHAHLYLFS